MAFNEILECITKTHLLPSQIVIAYRQRRIRRSPRSKQLEHFTLFLLAKIDLIKL
nr:MAG TPA: hypothetical protein [Caudoviricetes sp.]